MEIGLNFEITKEWFDVRLTYWNLKTRRYDNSLSIEDKYDYGRLICFDVKCTHASEIESLIRPAHVKQIAYLSHS